MGNAWKMSSVSFKLMHKNRDTAWFEVLQKYHRVQFYQFTGNCRGGFSGVVEDRANPEEFIDALVVQKTPESARLMDTMLMRLPQLKCLPKLEDIIEHLMLAIWNNPCPAYEQLRNKIRPEIEKMSESQKKGYSSSMELLPADSVIKRVVDTTEEEIWW